MGYAAKIIADSISEAGVRLTTFEVTFPRFILAEVNTHCILTKNSASSRAIPVAKRIAAVEFDPFAPEAFGKNRPGMQSTEALVDDAAEQAMEIWRENRTWCLAHAQELAELEVHKQYANRVLELHSWHTALISGTEWDNFFALRAHPDAQPEFQKLAYLMKETMAASTPKELHGAEWHLPYVDDETVQWALHNSGEQFFPWDTLKKISAGRCARLSYETQNGKRDPWEDIALFERLRASGHMSPTQHQGAPMTPEYIARYEAAVADFDHLTDKRPFSGQFACWRMFRKELAGERVFGGSK